MRSISARTVLSVSANLSFTRPGLCDSCAACSFLLLSLACRPCTTSTSGTWTWCALPKYTSRSITWPSTSSRTPGTKATDCGTRTFTMKRWRRRWRRCAPTPRNWTSTRRCCRAARVSEAQAAGQLTGQFWWWTNEKTTQCIPQPRTHHKPFSFTSLFSSFLFLILVLCIISTLTLSHSRWVFTRPQPQISKTSQQHDFFITNFLLFGHTNKSCELDLQKNSSIPYEKGLRALAQRVVPNSEQYDFS